MENYQKKLREYYRRKAKKDRKREINPEKAQKTKQTYFDKLYLRMFLSALLLLGFISMGRAGLSTPIREELNDNMNILKFVAFFNGIFGDTFIPTPDDIPVVSSTLYESVKYQDGINYVENTSFDGVYTAMTGVVVKIVKDDSGKYQITIKGYDDREYEYRDLESVDFSIYSFVPENAIIGKAGKVGEVYTFALIIRERGKPVDFYAICED
jgi:hypothetical protein